MVGSFGNLGVRSTGQLRIDAPTGIGDELALKIMVDYDIIVLGALGMPRCRRSYQRPIRQTVCASGRLNARVYVDDGTGVNDLGIEVSIC